MLQFVIVVILSNYVLTSKNQTVSENYVKLDGELLFSENLGKTIDDDLSQGSLIAFSAAKSKPLKGHKQKQFSVNYDHVFLNRGNQFDSETGTFTVLSAGIYEFTFSGGALPHRKLSLQLMKNHFEVQTLAFDGHRKRNPNIQSQKILLELESGDR